MSQWSVRDLLPWTLIWDAQNKTHERQVEALVAQLEAAELELRAIKRRYVRSVLWTIFSRSYTSETIEGFKQFCKSGDVTNDDIRAVANDLREKHPGVLHYDRSEDWLIGALDAYGL